MSDKISIESTTTNWRKPSKRIIGILAAGALMLAGGITAVSVSAANAASEETARQCSVALKSSASAGKSSTASLDRADEALEVVKSVALPGDASSGDTTWTSTEYQARAGDEAIEAVLAVEESEGVEAVAAVPARAGGAEMITSVTDSQEALTGIKVPTECVEREEAASITALATDVETATMTLDTRVMVLLDDFAAFQTDEAVRIAAEIEAARVAAAAEAARVAAEAEAARIAAERAAAANRYNGGGGSSSGGSTGGSSGGGGVGSGGSDGSYCLVDNGVGGTTFIPAPC